MKSYGLEISFKTIKKNSSSTQALLIIFRNCLRVSIKGTLAYYSSESESLFFVLWRRRGGRGKWRDLLTKGVSVPDDTYLICSYKYATFCVACRSSLSPLPVELFNP